MSANSTLASVGPSLTHLVSFPLVYLSLSSSFSYGLACSSPSCRVTVRMFIVGYVFGAVRSLRPYLHCQLVSSEIAGQSFTSRTTTRTEADQRMSMSALPHLLARF